MAGSEVAPLSGSTELSESTGFTVSEDASVLAAASVVDNPCRSVVGCSVAGASVPGSGADDGSTEPSESTGLPVVKPSSVPEGASVVEDPGKSVVGCSDG